MVPRLVDCHNCHKERNLKHNLPLDDVTAEHEDLPRLRVDPTVTAWLKGEQHLLETVQIPNSVVKNCASVR